MRTWLALAFAVLVANAFPAPAKEWNTVFSPEGYEVQFPGRPAYRQSTQDTLVGPVQEHEHTLSHGQASYTVNCSVLPKSALLFTGREAIYDRAVGALLEHNQALQTARRSSRISGRDGLELSYETRAGQAGLARMVLIANRLYVLDSSWSGSRPADVDRFFASARVRP